MTFAYISIIIVIIGVTCFLLGARSTNKKLKGSGKHTLGRVDYDGWKWFFYCGCGLESEGSNSERQAVSEFHDHVALWDEEDLRESNELIASMKKNVKLLESMGVSPVYDEGLVLKKNLKKKRHD